MVKFTFPRDKENKAIDAMYIRCGLEVMDKLISLGVDIDVNYDRDIPVRHYDKVIYCYFANWEHVDGERYNRIKKECEREGVPFAEGWF